ncbi:MAG: FAD-binding protein [Planctomycetia bacterium]|nr:FAD-binding protein [Planctomycetia bacterium]
MLDPKRERIQDDLRGLVDGDVFADTVSTQVYATDASLYEIPPMCVVCPRTTKDVVSVIRYARKNGLTIHPRGAGSNCVGAALGTGIVLDMSRYMRRLLQYNPKSNMLHVQAGIQFSRLNDFLRPHGRQMVAGTGHSLPNTLGGIFSMDGYGSRWLAYGRPSDWLTEVELVTANGNVLTFSDRELIEGDASTSSYRTVMPHVLLMDSREAEMFQQPLDEKKRILGTVNSALNRYLDTHGSTVNTRVIDKMGYRTNIQNGKLLNMARLIAGSEGTLGVITSVKMRLPEIPAVRKTILLLFTSMEKAMQAVPTLLQFHPEACDLLDRRYLHLAAERDVRFDTLFSDQAEAALLVDLSDSSQYNMLNRLRSISEQIVRQKELAFQLIYSVDDVEAAFFWEIAHTFEAAVRQGSGKPSRFPVMEDAAVSPTKLHEFFLKIQELLRKHGLTAAFYAHAIQGQVRLQPLADLYSPTEAERVVHFVRDYYQLIHSMNGTIGTENGLGIGWFWLPVFEHPRYELTCEIKRIFDPYMLFQPDKMGTVLEKGTTFTPEMLWRRAIRPEKPFPIQNGEQNSDLQVESRSESRSESRLEMNLLDTQTVRRNTDIQTSRIRPEVGDVVNSVLENTPIPASPEESASGVFVMEKVREILGNAFDNFAEETYGGNLPKKKDLETESGWLTYESLTSLGLDWDADKIREIADCCNGCAKCRMTEQVQRMCPIFRYNCSEFSSPRAKVNLMEGLLNKTLDLTELGDDRFHNVFQQCFQCHSCRVECPAGVDVPFLVRRAGESWAKARGLNFYETSLVRLDTWIRRFQKVPYLVNYAFSTGWLRWIMGKSFGIAPGRELPRIESRTFLDKISRNPSILARNPFETPLDENPIFGENTTEIQGRVVYFLDTYANHFDSATAQATVRVFLHNNVPFVVPPRQEGSGSTAVMLGRSDYIQKQVYRNAAMLADYIRQGYDVVLTEPSATLAFRWEYPQTFPENEDIKLVSQHCFDAGEYLYKLHVLQLLKMPKKAMEMKIGYHAPCRLRALKIGFPSLHLLRLIPGLEAQLSPHGCCGMGGPNGMLAENYSASLKMGRPLQTWMRNPMIQLGVTECSSCRLQMMQNNTKPVLHPIQILAQAYGCE